ncbi:Flp pilus assembly protein CpaB [Mesorhizobium sp. CAU 1741]|uniref:Flp pilus assembly protein CpaB n=1 Tax=Mesorhizobium sp. CAU 1741 TaxID=3140366 RepID=UPI00325A610A
MKRKVIAMIGIAAVFGAVSIFVADVWLRSQASARIEAAPVLVASAPDVAFGKIVVASAPLRYGAPLDAAQLVEIPWPAQSRPEGAFASIDDLMGEGPRVVLSPMEPNEPVLLAKLSGPNGRASLSNLLSPGMRAVTVRTDEIAGVGGFITPGDRVDVVLTRDAGAIQEVSGNARGASGSTIATEIVVSNARVLTVGQGADTRETGPQVVDSVTLEVTMEGAQKVALARNVGTLSLSLRSAGEGGLTPDGLTTISSFGGSLGSGVTEAVGSLFGNADEPAGPRLTTVIVTRGMTETQSYEVVSPVQ